MGGHKKNKGSSWLYQIDLQIELAKPLQEHLQSAVLTWLFLTDVHHEVMNGTLIMLLRIVGRAGENLQSRCAADVGRR